MGATRNFTLDLHRLSKAGFYNAFAPSGLITTVAAGTASAGHLFAARYVPAGAGLTKLFHVTRLRFHWETISGFTAGQELALAAFKLTGYSVAHSGGTAITPLALAPGYSASQLAARIATTGELTAGTHTIGSQLLRGAFAELAGSSAVQKGFIDEEAMGSVHPVVVLGSNEGILIRNEVLQGAGGTGRLTVEVDGYERAA